MKNTTEKCRVCGEDLQEEGISEQPKLLTVNLFNSEPNLHNLSIADIKNVGLGVCAECRSQIIDILSQEMQESPPLTRKELDEKCCNPDDNLFLQSTCHTNAPMMVYYNNGVLTIKCSICEQIVEKIAVDSGEQGIHPLLIS